MVANVTRVLFAVLMLCAVESVHSADYYLNAETGNDTQDGTSAGTAWKTLDRATAEAESLRTGSDSLFFHLAPGNYGDLVWSIPGDFTAGAVWKASDRYNPARLTRLALSGDSCRAHQVFDGLLIKLPSASKGRDPVTMSGVGHVTIRNSEIMNEDLYDGEGIRMSSVYEITVSNCHIHDVVAGIRFNGIGLHITGNRLYRIPGSLISTFCGGYAPIYPWSASDVEISDNDLQHPTGDYPTEPGYENYDEPAELHASIISIRGGRFLIDHNVMHNIKDNPYIQFYGGDCGVPDYLISDITITNNLAYGLSGSGGFLHIPGNGKPDGPVVVENNTIIGSWVACMLDTNYTGTGTVIRNNLIKGGFTGALNHNEEDYDGPDADWVTEHNLVNNKGWQYYDAKIHPSNLFVEDLITAGTFPADFWDTQIFADPEYVDGSTVFGDVKEVESWRWIPKPGCTACTAGTGGGYLGALPCISDSEAVAAILQANGDFRTVDDVAVFNGSGRATELYLQNDAGGTAYDLTMDIGRLTELTVLHLNGPDNHDHAVLRVTDLNPAIGGCTKLTELLLDDNDLEKLPVSLTGLTGLTDFSISNNVLFDLPDTLRAWLDVHDPDWESTQDVSGVPVAVPEISPATGSYDDTVTVSMACVTENAVIRYTTDGSDPTQGSAAYSAPFSLTGTAVITARSFLAGRAASLAATAAYTVLIDTFAPGIISSTVMDSATVKVVFSEVINAADASDAGNFTVPGLTVLSAAPAGGGTSVLLTVSPMNAGTEYTLTVGSVRDSAITVNTSAGLTNSFTYRTINAVAIHMPLDDNLDDISGNGFSSFWSAGTSYTDGIDGRAVAPLADTTSVTISMPGPVPLENTATLTLCAWGKKDDAGSGGVLVYRHVLYSLGVSADGGSGRITNADGTSVSAVGSGLPGDTDWHHYAMTYDGQTIRMFIDGAEVADAAQSGLIRNDAGRDINLGVYPYGGTPFNGAIDEVRMYDWALSPTQILQVYRLHRPVGIRDGSPMVVDGTPGITVMPNPAAGAVLITVPAGSTEPVEVLDMNGTVVRSFTGTARWNGCSLSGRPVENGIYYVRSGNAVKRIVMRR